MRDSSSGPSAPSGGAPAPPLPSMPAGVLSKMGHELRSPLNGVIGLTRIMLMKLAAGPVDAGQQIRQLEMVQTSANRLLASIERLVDIAKIESGGRHPSWESVDCTALAAEVTRLLEPAADANRVTLLLASPDGPVVVTSDPGALRQLLRELVDNAVKFADPGAGRVHVEVRPVDPEGAAQISVTDNGPGIPAPDQDRIFDAFVRGDAAAQRDENGSGLGLYLAARLAGLLGARLRLERLPGAGSSFTISIPANPYYPVAKPTARPAATTAMPSQTAG